MSRTEDYVTSYKGAKWPSVASMSDRVGWAFKILEPILSIKLPEPTCDPRENLRVLAIAIASSVEYDKKISDVAEREAP